MLKNSNTDYGLMTKMLHWLSAVFILPAMLIGLWFAWVDLDTDYGWEQFERYIDWHVGFGVTVISLMLLRTLWRLTNVSPGPSERISPLQERVASGAHKMLYVFAILTPLTGWLGSSLEGHSLHYFSVIEIPPFLGVYPQLSSLMTEAHSYISWGFVVLLSTHLIAVLHHHLWLKHNVLGRML